LGEAFFAHVLDKDDPTQPKQVWIVFTILAQNRTACAYFWAEIYGGKGGLDLDLIRAVAQKLANDVLRTGSISQQANQYLHYLHQAGWAAPPVPEAKKRTIVETIEQFLDDSREDNDQAN
jgi:hypothetical protein